MWHYLGRGTGSNRHTHMYVHMYIYMCIHTHAQTVSCLQSVRDQRERIKCGPANGILNMSFFSTNVKMSVRVFVCVCVEVVISQVSCVLEYAWNANNIISFRFLLLRQHTGLGLASKKRTNQIA